MNKNQYNTTGIFFLIITTYIWIFYPIPTHLIGDFGDVSRAPVMFEIISRSILFTIGKLSPFVAILFFILGSMKNNK
jgi:hypothetical protein